MSGEQPSYLDRLWRLMNAKLLAYRDEVSVRRSFRFVHYTSADTAKTILDTQKIWLRNARLMNDFSEIEYGLMCWQRMLESQVGQRLRNALTAIVPGDNLAKLTDWSDHRALAISDTYIFCMSEHGALGDRAEIDIPSFGKVNREDIFGRLSMWRAYGGTSGAAIVLKSDMFLSEETHVNLYSTPVRYITPIEFIANYEPTVKFLEDHIDEAKIVGAQAVVQFLKADFVSQICSTKHPGFEEEREWRIIYNPLFAEYYDEAPHHRTVVRFRDATISGIPQQVLVVDLQRLVEVGQLNALPEKLVDKILVGPSMAPRIVQASLRASAKRQNIPEGRVEITDIPLRQ